MRWHLQSNLADVRLQLAAAMARAMLPRGLTLTVEPPLPPKPSPSVLACLQEIGLGEVRTVEEERPAQSAAGIQTLLFLSDESPDLSDESPDLTDKSPDGGLAKSPPAPSAPGVGLPSLPAAEKVVLIKASLADEGDPAALRALRERLREHLRDQFARKLDQPADPEAQEGWIRDPDRRA